MKSTFTFLVISFLSLNVFGQLNMELRGQVEYTQTLNDIWGYADGQGNEYALVGAVNGVSIVNVTDPDTPTEVAFLPGVNSTWRDMKTWGTNAYVTNETGDGLMVIDLSALPDTATAYNWQPMIPGLGTLNDCHNIFIDEFGFAYLAGCNLNNGGLLYVNVDTPDGAPEYINAGVNRYSHDVYVRDNLAYSSEIQQGVFTIYDVTDKSNTLTLGSQATPSSTTHNAWLSDDSQYLFTTDETGNAPIGSYDISDPSNIIELDQFRPTATIGDGVVPHNVHVWNDWIIVSYYSDGCIVIDGSEPDNLVEVGNFDTWLSPGTGFSGAWGAYPYLPSQTVLVTDQENGLFVMTPTYVRAARVEGRVFNEVTNEDLPGASVFIDGTNTVELTNISGVYKTGYHTGGNYSFIYSKPGYEPKVIAADIVNDETLTLDVGLVPLESFAYSGMVLDEMTGEFLQNAEVKIVNDDFEFIRTTDENGQFYLDAIFEGNYSIAVGKWGYETKFFNDLNLTSSTNNMDFNITAGYEDIFSLDLGWVISGNVNSGDWELVKPLGLFVEQVGIFITPPEDDVDAGEGAYVTQNGLDIFDDAVAAGNTTLTSPIFNMEGAVEPKLSYSAWFFSVNPYTMSGGNDKMTVSLTNGDTTAVLETYIMPQLSAPSWLPTEINIKDIMEPTATMKISITIGNGDDDITEGGFDNFKAWDAMPPSGTTNIDELIQFTSSPNPSSDFFTLSLDTEKIEAGQLTIYSIVGQPIESISLQRGAAQIQVGANYQKGIYLAQLQQNGKLLKTLKLIKQ